jgi:5-methylthioadenosine/S-adenosylhomocysteine deaminase
MAENSPGVPGAIPDRFLSAYLAGNTGPAPQPEPEPEAEPEADSESLLADAPVMRSARAAPADSIALGGHILGPDGPVRGWITIASGLIVAIGTDKPDAARTVATDGLILPGLIDLHGHPEFNVFNPWEPPKTYLNRYAWRGSDEYHTLIRDPQNALLGELPPRTQLRYAEIRALVGGVTAIQGASTRALDESESLVRNVDGLIFGQRHARALIDLPSSLTGQGGTELTHILDGITAGDVTAFYAHLAEGRRASAASTSSTIWSTWVRSPPRR